MGRVRIPKTNKKDIQRFTRMILRKKGAVVELRALFDPATGGRTQSGYYDDPDRLAEDAAKLSDMGAKGVYVTLNSVEMAALHSLAPLNTFGPAKTGQTATDADVTHLQFVLIDIDPVRLPNTNATDEEMHLALDIAAQVDTYLRGKGFPEPLIMMSGNGAQLLYRVDLSATEVPKIKDLYAHLDLLFSSDKVKLDLKVSNPSRITKAAGTVTRKGPHTDERPQRTAYIISMPDPMEVVPQAALDALVEKHRALQAATTKDASGQASSGAVKASPSAPPWPTDTVGMLLGYLPARLDYDEWMRMIAATHDAVADRDTAIELLKKRWPEEVPGEYECKIDQYDKVSRVALYRAAQKAGYRGPHPSTVNPSGGSAEGGSAAAQILRLGHEIGITTWRSEQGLAYITVPHGTSEAHYPLEVDAVTRLLSHQIYRKTGRTPASQAFVDAVGVLTGQALYEGDVHRVNQRVATDGKSIWIDLGAAHREVIEVTASGWRQVPSTACPVRFVRRGGMEALPEPVRGGSVNELRRFLNPHVTDDDLTLILCFLVQVLSGQGPYPMLLLTGSAGSGKSLTAGLIRRLVDPCTPLLSNASRSEQDLFVSALNNHMVTMDNVSVIPDLFSDAMCRVLTGGGLSMRKLYTTSEEFTIAVQRPVIMTAIEDVVDRQDLLDRTVSVPLRRIDDGKRTSERELMEAFEKAHPGMFGALLDGLVVGLQRRSTLKPAWLPRLADFGIWAMACEPGLGLAPGAVERALKNNRSHLVRTSLESHLVAELVYRLVATAPFEGTATRLSEVLRGMVEYGRMHEFPRSPNGLTRVLRTLEPGLLEVGIEIEFTRSNAVERRRLVRIRRIENEEK